MKKIILIILCCLLVSGWFLYRSARGTHSGSAISLTFTPTDDNILNALGRGVERLTKFREENGAFIKGYLAPQAAITAAVLEALTTLPPDFLTAQTPEYRAELSAIIRNAQNAIMNYAQPDGGIYKNIPGYSFGVYSTAYALTALRNSGIAADHPILQNAQKYLINAQHQEKGLYLGGVGYQVNARPDLNNTTAMLEALNASGLPHDHPAYQNAISYISSCQNRSESNQSGIAVTDDGGFFYTAASSVTGKDSVRNHRGEMAYASYGSMSYAGLIAFLYAAVDKNDARVKSALTWIKNNYDLQENVGKKSTGLYYYYRVMAKALAHYGEKIIVTADGVEHNWARELAAQIISLQRHDGGWLNDNPRFLENDEVLVSAYALRTLIICYPLTQ